jgi:polygalacturonase
VAPAPAPSAPPAATIASCSRLPPMPTKPATFKNVKNFGAKGDGRSDDTAAIQNAINSLNDGEWLVFPAGTYVHSAELRVRRPNVVLWSEGATLKATNPERQAVWLEANGASVYNFTMTAVTDVRRTAPWNSRIAIFPGSNANFWLSGNVIRNNRIIAGGAPGSSLQNSASSAGIFVYRATNFLVAENLVQRSLADAIHMTAGSYNGRVLNNTVREPGDDMIAVVSYLGSPNTMFAGQVAAEHDSRAVRDLSRDIWIANNDVSGNYWGRGITVVGGQNVTIESNRIDQPHHGAGIYLTREYAYLTFGVRNILVRNNRISNVQTSAPTFNPTSKGWVTTYHGGVEIYAHLFTDEAANPTLVDKLAVQNIAVINNTVTNTKADGVRIGVGAGRTWSYAGRTVTGGRAGLIGLQNNALSSIGGTALNIINQPTTALNDACSGNTLNGSPTGSPKCSGAMPVVTGARMTCS